MHIPGCWYKGMCGYKGALQSAGSLFSEIGLLEQKEVGLSKPVLQVFSIFGLLFLLVLQEIFLKVSS